MSRRYEAARASSYSDGKLEVTYFVREEGADWSICDECNDRNGLPSEAVAERIAACLNACVGISTADLVRSGATAGAETKHERDEARGALKQLIHAVRFVAERAERKVRK